MCAPAPSPKVCSTHPIEQGAEQLLETALAAEVMAPSH
jgi:hypothetical protein